MSSKQPAYSVSKARQSLTLLQMERSLFEERKKSVKTAMKEKRDTRNLNMKSSDSVERYRKELD
jgi:hypothetical protein